MGGDVDSWRPPTVGLLLHDQPFDFDLKPAPRVLPDLTYVHNPKKWRF